MFYRLDHLMQRSADRKFAFPAVDLFHMDIIDSCFRAANDNHVALALCCDCSRSDKEEVMHWLKHYHLQRPATKIAPVARNVSGFDEAMQALLLGYRGIWLADTVISAQEIREIVRISAAADAAVAVTVSAEMDNQQMLHFAQEAGAPVVVVDCGGNKDPEKVPAQLEKIRLLRASGFQVGVCGAHMKAVEPARSMYNAGVSMVDIHRYVEANAKKQKEEAFAANDHTPMLFLNLVTYMGNSVADSVKAASILLYANRREF